jgi:uncharacterized membrane protein YdbT with pleckstrin-like domain
VVTPTPPGSATPGTPAAAPADVPEQLLFEGHPAVVPGVGAVLVAIVTLGLALIVYWFRARGTHYRITSQRIVIDYGIFSKRLEQVDLYRIRDYTVERPFGQRLLGTGNILIEAMDSSTPVVRIHGLRADVVELYERLRVATEAGRRARGVRLIDYE